MSRLSEAAKYPVFSNGTEGNAWTSKWCDLCVRDHGMHNGDYDTDGSCSLFLDALVHNSDSGHPLPEAWLPEPDDGKFFLPSRMVCLAFEPCRGEGCDGDPGADARAERVVEVVTYWKEAE